MTLPNSSAGRSQDSAPAGRWRSGGASPPKVALLLAAAALWLPLLWRWRRAWSIAPDQAYGWAVPILALYLIRERALHAPAPAPDTGAGRPVAAILLALGLFVYAAALPVLEANALWPTAQWAGALAAAATTIAALAWAADWTQAAHYAFPICFLFTSLTWPTPLKVWVVNHLATGNARLAADIVSVFGHPAVVSGNVITVATGLIGVDEACSGLRSLQAVGMAAFFFGEYFRLNVPRRVAVMGASFIAAWAANLARTAWLTQLAAAHDIATSERWHDRAGAAELVVTLAVVVLLSSRAAARTRIVPPKAATARMVPAAVFSVRRLRAAAVAVFVVGLFSEAGTQIWYGMHELGKGRTPQHWRLRAPDSAWQPVVVPARAVAVLQSSAADGLLWRDPRSGAKGWAFVVAWEGGAAQGENPEWHDPTICLPAAGANRVADWGLTQVAVGGLALPFAGYSFVADGRPLAVFFCHWDGELAGARAEGGVDPHDLRSRRWRRVAEGRRQGDVAHLTLMLETGDEAAARRWLETWAPRVLTSGSGPAHPPPKS